MSNDQVITLEVLGDGTFLWNGAHLSDAQVIRSRFQAIAAQSPQPQIHLKANRDAGYEAVADLLREAQRDGVHKIGFVGTEAP